jgi:hypothetical protein
MTKFRNDGMSERDLIKERRYVRLLTRELLAELHGDDGEYTAQHGMVKSLQTALEELREDKDALETRRADDAAIEPLSDD